MLAGVQQVMIGSQVEAYVEQQRQCPHCQQPLAYKGHHQIGVCILFGKLTLSSPRLYTCSCQPQKTRSWSPVAALFAERSTPELLCQEVRWASLLSYGVTVKLLGDLLPMERQLSTSTIFRHVHQVAERLESELGDEQPSFITGCPAQWYELPEPAAPLVVSIDGGYVHARSKTQRKDGSFEVIVGKSTTGDGATTRFGLVSGYDPKPRRRLFEVLQAQGLQMNQTITFLTDGGASLRDLTDGHSPQSTYILDWFHIAMRLTVLGQMGNRWKMSTKAKSSRKNWSGSNGSSGTTTSIRLCNCWSGWIRILMLRRAMKPGNSPEFCVSLTTTFVPINRLFPIMAIATAMGSQFPHPIRIKLRKEK